VLLCGESGTGKELFAREMHAHSHRADHPFIAVDCSTFSSSLLESELFGHTKGAFTGAVQDKEGIFSAAEPRHPFSGRGGQSEHGHPGETAAGH
jgi:two-component system NtrC family response regulator